MRSLATMNAGGRQGKTLQTYYHEFEYEVESGSDERIKVKRGILYRSRFCIFLSPEFTCETSRCTDLTAFFRVPSHSHSHDTACSSPPISRPDWVTNIAARGPLAGVAEDGTDYNTNLPDLTEGWW